MKVATHGMRTWFHFLASVHEVFLSILEYSRHELRIAYGLTLMTHSPRV
jgi:hypothetical protein